VNQENGRGVKKMKKRVVEMIENREGKSMNEYEKMNETEEEVRR
jgi:hypothetical protein